VSSSPHIDPAVAAAIDRLATAFAKDPRSKAFLPLADEYIKAGMWQEAAAVLEDGLAIHPTFITAMAALGRVYDQLGQPEKAKAILEQVIAHSPDNLRAHRILAKLFTAEHQGEAALRSCRAILSANPNDEEALSIQRRLTGPAADHPIPTSEPIADRLQPESTGTAPIPVVSAPNVDCSELAPTESPILTPTVPRHAAIIAQLEAWLHTVQANRRAASETP